MELSFSPAEQAFEQEVRDFVRNNLPGEIAEKVRRGQKIAKEDHVIWQQILNDHGWVAPSWSTEFGGPGWTPTEGHIFDSVISEFDVPPTITIGVGLVGPVIYTFGRQDQKDYFLPRIKNYEHWWCQGYSEPNAGSDLASLTTKAVLDGDDYVVNGTKTWTTYAQWSDWMFCLVRTDPGAKVQEGISFILIDLKTPGIEVRPIDTIDGVHHLNMVHFTDVRVPVRNRIGEENKGWTYAKFLLGNERTGISDVGGSKRRLNRIKEIASAEFDDGSPLREVSSFANKVVAVEVDLLALEQTNLRFLSAQEAGEDIGAKASMLKIKGSELRQRLTELSVEAVGYYAMAADPRVQDPGWNEPAIGPEYANLSMADYLYSRASSIYGGTNEVQHNIIAKMVLGL